MARNKTFRLDDTLTEALKNRADELGIAESDVVRKALVCFLGIKFDNDCASYDELQQTKARLNQLLEHLKISHI